MTTFDLSINNISRHGNLQLKIIKVYILIEKLPADLLRLDRLRILIRDLLHVLVLFLRVTD